MSKTMYHQQIIASCPFINFSWSPCLCSWCVGVCVGGLMGEYVITCGCGDDTGVGVWSAEHSDEASACSRTLPSVTPDRHKFPNSLIPVTQKIILMYRKFPSRCLLFYRDLYGSWTCGNEFERLRVGEKKSVCFEKLLNTNTCGNKTSGNEEHCWRRASWSRTTAQRSCFRKICCFNINSFNCSVRGVTRCNVVLKGWLQTSYTC